MTLAEMMEEDEEEEDEKDDKNKHRVHGGGVMRFVLLESPWRSTTYDMPLEELIRASAEARMSDLEVQYRDGCLTKGTVPSEDAFVDSLYADIVGGKECEINLDGARIDFVFPESVRFYGTSKIKSTIRDCYYEVLMTDENTMDLLDMYTRLKEEYDALEIAHANLQSELRFLRMTMEWER